MPPGRSKIRPQRQWEISWPRSCEKKASQKKKQGERFLSGPLPSVVVHPIVGQRVGQTKTAKINPPKLFSKQSKTL